jgi:uncharacterized membrane protein YtjA (UPF0391 family)
MLKRAYFSAVIAAIAAIFGFSGLLQDAAPIAKGVSYAFAAFCGLSLLFSLFEDVSEPPPPPQLTSQDAAPQLVFNFSAEQPALSPIPTH